MRFRDEAEYQEFLKGRKVDPLTAVIRKHGFEGAVPRPSRERNHKITVNGEVWHSKWEFERWQQLLMEAAAGKITELRRQVEYILAPPVVILGRKRPPLRYFLDFQYKRDGKPVYEDAKGKLGATDTYRIKRHLMKSCHGIDITEIRREKGRK